MKILIVDDDPLALQMLASTLERAGHQVVAARDGLEALEAVATGTCRMVLTDWQMPGMTGMELCRYIRSATVDRYIYLILLTSRDSIDDGVVGLQAGADDVVSKPCHPTELLMRVRAGERVLSLETRDLAIFMMAKLADSRDADTGAHLERVRSYSKALATQMASHGICSTEMDRDFIHLTYLTSPLHDIGKVAIPDTILLKPGPLTEDEYAVMKTHTTRGAETLEAALKEHPEAAFLTMARDIALAHHERFNGTGYPRGLSGRSIPLAARIVTLADTYDAITQVRVYKPALPHEYAVEFIRSQSGLQFDPDVVSAFFACEEEFQTILGEHRAGDAVAA